MSSTSTRTAIEPLRALRYDRSRVALDDVICPPYDVISPADREALLKRSEYGVVRLELPDTANEAAQQLHEWRRDGPGRDGSNLAEGDPSRRTPLQRGPPATSWS